MTLIAYPMKHGPPRWGYRFIHYGVLYKRRVGSKSLAAEAEKRERARLDIAIFGQTWGPLKPIVTSWADVVAKYEVAKVAKRSLKWDQTRLVWWGTFLAGRKITSLQAITPELIDQAKAQLAADGKSPATQQRYLAVLRALCNMAVRRWRLLAINPVSEVDWPQVPRVTKRIPTKEERWALLEAADPVLRRLILTALYTGLREGAILALTAEDFRVRPGWLRCQDEKGAKEYFIPVAAPLYRMVQVLGIVQGRIFRDARGKVITRFPEERWRKLRDNVGLLWLTFHRLRDTCATVLSEAGVPQRVIQVWLAHSKASVTEGYTIPQEAGFLAAAQALEENLGI